MKTYNLDEAAAEFDRIHPSQDCVCDRIVATGAVQAIKPIRPTLEDTPDLADRISRKIFSLGDDPNSPCQRIQFLGGVYPFSEKYQGGLAECSLSNQIRPCILNLLADTESLNDEIEHLRAVAQRSQQREVVAVKRCDQLEQSLYTSRALCDMIRTENQLLKGRP